MSDCQTITVRGLPPDLEITFTGEPRPRQPPDMSYFVSCQLVPATIDLAAYGARQRTADLVFDRLEIACPQLFQPRGLRSDYIGYGWQRIYLNTDLVAWISHDAVAFHDPVRGGRMYYLGRESDWAKHSLPLECGRRHDRYFAKLISDGAGS